MEKNRIMSLVLILIYSFMLLAKETPINSIHSHEKIPFGSAEFFLYVFYAFCIVMFAGLMSGLTVGYNSIDFLHLELVLNGGTEE